MRYYYRFIHRILGLGHYGDFVEWSDSGLLCNKCKLAFKGFRIEHIYKD